MEENIISDNINKLSNDIINENQHKQNKDSFIYFGNYNYEEDGTKKPIEWKILKKEESKLLIITKFGINAMPYNNITTVWEYCKIRKWLNKEFYMNAFSKNEQDTIIESVVCNHKNPDYDISSGNDTIDKIFLLSIDEAKSYFSSNKDRVITATPYAVSQGACINEITGTCWWWLRTVGLRLNYVSIVNLFGSVRTDGNNILVEYNCIRPALWLDLDKMKDKSFIHITGEI